MARSRRSRRWRRYPRRMSGGIGSIRVVKAAGGRALSRMKEEARRTEARMVAGAIAGAYGIAEKNNAIPDAIPAFLDDRTHTIAAVAAVAAMFSKGQIRKYADHVANAMIPISMYKLGKNGLDPERDGLLRGGLAADLQDEIDELAGEGEDY